MIFRKRGGEPGRGVWRVAFVPDEAIKRRRRDKLSPAAWDVYVAHCMRRNHREGVSRAGKQKIAEDTGLSLSGVKNAMTELSHKGWARAAPNGVELLVGDFSPVNKSSPRPASSQAAPRPEISTPRPEMRPTEPDPSTSRPEVRRGAYRGSRAWSDQPINQPENQPHTPERGGEGEGRAEACAGVPDLTFDDYFEFARSRPTIHTPEAWASEHFSRRDRDEVVRRHLADEARKRQAGGQAVAGGGDGAPRDMEPAALDELADSIQAVVEVQGRDAAEMIASLTDISESDRARLLTRFNVRDGPPTKTVKARAGTP